MISIRVDNKKNIVLDASGNVQLAEEIGAIGQNCVTALSAQYGEMIFALEDGVPTLSSVWEKYNPAQFESAARQVLSQVEGVLEVISFWQAKQGDTLSYAATVKTVFGNTNISSSITT